MADTIAAIATPPGEGGIGIVRVSGNASLEIMKALFLDCPKEVKERHAYYGQIVNGEGMVIDEAICIYMKAPHTYTCEDVLEIQAHGNIVSLRMILRASISAGARMAEPGEFTKLAFLNGRLDLTQAEAVTDLIKAKGELPHNIAVGQLTGTLGEAVREIRGELTDTLAQMAVNIDFPDEDIEQAEYDRLVKELKEEREKTAKLIETADTGRIAKEGIKAVIVGRPNVGKSSLLNSVLGENRVIVTSVPGTTRDTIEEQAQISGIPITFVDTAGIRSTVDEVEIIGIEKSRDEIEEADLIIFVVDGSEELTEADYDIVKSIQRKKVLTAINKEDLETVLTENEILKFLPGTHIVKTSFKSYEKGAAIILGEMEKLMATEGLNTSYSSVVTNERQLASLQNAKKSIDEAIDLLNKAKPLEIAEIDAHSALDSLGEVIGESAGEEILDAVFSKFCLGK